MPGAQPPGLGGSGGHPHAQACLVDFKGVSPWGLAVEVVSRGDGHSSNTRSDLLVCPMPESPPKGTSNRSHAWGDPGTRHLWLHSACHTAAEGHDRVSHTA